MTLQDLFRRKLYEYIIRNHFRNCKKIVDIGAGNSQYLYIYAKKKNVNFYKIARSMGKKVDAIDIAPESKEIKKLDFNDIKRHYDGFFSSYFFEHINVLDYMEIAKKYCDKVIVTITTDYFKGFWDEPTHFRPYTIKSVNALYWWYGFKPVKSIKFYPTNSFMVVGHKIRK